MNITSSGLKYVSLEETGAPAVPAAELVRRVWAQCNKPLKLTLGAANRGNSAAHIDARTLRDIGATRIQLECGVRGALGQDAEWRSR